MPKFLGNFAAGSQEWLDLRKGEAVVTGTLVGSICGLSPWESAYTAWAKATGRISDVVEESDSMLFGKIFEEPIKQMWLAKNPEFSIESDVGTWSEESNDWARANPDGLLVWPNGTKGILEVKTSRMPFDEVPAHYRAQVLWYCFVMGVTKAKLLAQFEIGRPPREFDIEFDLFEFSALMAAVKRWRECVLSDSAPDWDGSANTLETVKFMNPGVSESGVDLGDLGIYVQNAQNDFDKAQTVLNEMKSRTIDALGDAKFGYVHVAGEQYVVCTRSVNRNGVVSLTIKKGKNV